MCILQNIQKMNVIFKGFFLHNLIYQVLFPEFFLQLVIKHKLYCSVGDIDQVRNQTLKDTKTK